MKLSWLKLDVDILGDSLFVLWVGLLTMAMRSDMDGHIVITKGAPYTPDEISTILKIPKKTVLMGIELFQRFGMIEVGDYSDIVIKNFCTHQSIDEIRQKQAPIEARKEQSRLSSPESGKEITIIEKLAADFWAANFSQKTININN